MVVWPHPVPDHWSWSYLLIKSFLNYSGWGSWPLGLEQCVSWKPVTIRNWGEQSRWVAQLQRLEWDLKSQSHLPGTSCCGAEEGLYLLQTCCVQGWGVLHWQTSSCTSQWVRGAGSGQRLQVGRGSVLVTEGTHECGVPVIWVWVLDLFSWMRWWVGDLSST